MYALALADAGADALAVTRFALPLLAPHESALEKCVYCPKLSRAACPVSNVEASETVTPWGKMSTAFFMARGDVPIDDGHASTAWACSGCFACRERCEHKNEVATALMDARADLFRHGVAPAAAHDLARRWTAREAEIAEQTEAIDRAIPGGRSSGARGKGKLAVLVGCGYVQRAPEVAKDAIRAVSALVGARATPLAGCCGLPLLHAGDRDGFLAAGKRMIERAEGFERRVIVDPGCARAMTVELPRLGVTAPPFDLAVDLAAAARASLRPIARITGVVRYHDPCQLGRGLGRYEAPRAVLERVAKNAEIQAFFRERGEAECSGGGGLLPVTRPETSAQMADARIAEHKRRGAGLLVTHCASSLARFRSRGEGAEDLVSLVAESLLSPAG